MKRRDFLKISGAAVGLAAVGSKLIAADSTKNSISIDIITDKPRIAENYLINIIPSLFSEPLSYSSKQIVGQSSSDICILKKGRLIDYRNDLSPLSRSIKELALKLQMPYLTENPHLLSLRIGNSKKFEYFEICKENKIIERIPVSDTPKDLLITSNYGEMKFEFTNGTVRATEASCTHKNCIKTGSVSNSGQNIICIPSRITLTTSRPNGIYDAFSR